MDSENERRRRLYRVAAIVLKRRDQGEADCRGLAPACRNRKTYSIKTFFASLTQSGYLRKHVASELLPPTIPHKDRRFLSEDEYQRVHANVHTVRDRAVLELFQQSGFRLSELVNLTVTDLELPKRLTRDPENVGLIRVHRKRGKEVYLPVNWKACEALAKGGDLRSVQEMLGHERIETTQIYLGLVKKVQRRMVQEFAL